MLQEKEKAAKDAKDAKEKGEDAGKPGARSSCCCAGGSQSTVEGSGVINKHRHLMLNLLLDSHIYGRARVCVCVCVCVCVEMEP